MLAELRAKYRAWRDRRFLQRHGCDSWEQYNRVFDPDYDIRASRVADYYHGYLCWHVFDNHNHCCYDLVYDYGPGGYRYGYHEIIDWLKDNCQAKYRVDLMRTYYTGTEWIMNEIGGGDYVFVAFKSEQDATLFKLRWS